VFALYTAQSARRRERAQCALPLACASPWLHAVDQSESVASTLLIISSNVIIIFSVLGDFARVRPRDATGHATRGIHGGSAATGMTVPQVGQLENGAMITR
jgi:hypothetical protein